MTNTHSEDPLRFIDEFVGHRWREATEELRRLDPEYFERFYLFTSPQGPGQDPALMRNVPPRKRLSSEWHALFEKCEDLMRRAMILLHVAEEADSLDWERLGDLKGAMSWEWTIDSWIVAVHSLGESVRHVLRCSLEILPMNARDKKQMLGRYGDSIRKRLQEPVGQERNQYVHPAKTPSMSWVTQDESWEILIASGTTPRQFLEEASFPHVATTVHMGANDALAPDAKQFVISAGEILLEFENETNSLRRK